MSADRLRLRVVTPTRAAVDTEADEVSVPAVLGVVGVLPGHAPLLASLRTGELVYRLASNHHSVALFGGFVEVRDNVVTVLADAAELPEEIDLAAAQALRAEAEQAMQTEGGAALDAARLRLATAITRITVAGRRPAAAAQHAD
jgi:F-type H+-transporting ATPase subunit epsilon